MKQARWMGCNRKRQSCRASLPCSAPANAQTPHHRRTHGHGHRPGHAVCCTHTHPPSLTHRMPPTRPCVHDPQPTQLTKAAAATVATKNARRRAHAAPGSGAALTRRRQVCRVIRRIALLSLALPAPRTCRVCWREHPARCRPLTRGGWYRSSLLRAGVWVGREVVNRHRRERRELQRFQMSGRRARYK